MNKSNCKLSYFNFYRMYCNWAMLLVRVTGRQFESLEQLPSFIRIIIELSICQAFITQPQHSAFRKFAGLFLKVPQRVAMASAWAIKSCEICFGHRNHIIGNSGSLACCCFFANFLLTSHARHVHLVGQNSFLKTWFFNTQLIKGDE